MGRSGVKKQRSIVESFKKANNSLSEKKEVVQRQSLQLLCQDILDSLKQEFGQLKQAVHLVGKSSDTNMQDAQNDFQEKAKRLLAFMNRSISRGLGGGNALIRMLVQILSDWYVHKCAEVAIESFALLKNMLIDGDCWNAYDEHLLDMDLYDFLVNCVEVIQEIQQGKACAIDHLGQLLLFQYIILTLKEDAQQIIAGESSASSIKACQLYKTLQLSIGAHRTFSRFILQLFQVIVGHNQRKSQIDCTYFTSAKLACCDFLRFTILFLNLCENKGLFYKHSCRINFRMQIDQVLVEQVMCSEDLQDTHKRSFILTCLNSKDRVRFWGLLICHCLLKDKPNTKTTDAFSKAYYFYVNSTELKTMFSIQPLDILKYINSNSGFKFCVNKLFENCKKRCAQVENVAWLVVDVMHSLLDTMVSGEILDLLEGIIQLMTDYCPKINQQAIKQLAEFQKQLVDVLG